MPQPNGRQRDGETPPKTPKRLIRRPDGRGALMSGGTNKGGGRTPRPVRLFCREMIERPEVQREILATASDRAAPGFTAMIRLLCEYAYGKPTQRVEVTGLAALALRLEALPEAELLRLRSEPAALDALWSSLDGGGGGDGE